MPFVYFYIFFEEVSIHLVSPFFIWLDDFFSCIFLPVFWIFPYWLRTHWFYFIYKAMQLSSQSILEHLSHPNIHYSQPLPFFPRHSYPFPHFTSTFSPFSLFSSLSWEVLLGKILKSDRASISMLYSILYSIWRDVVNTNILSYFPVSCFSDWSLNFQGE